MASRFRLRLPLWWNGRHAGFRYQCLRACGFKSREGYGAVDTACRQCLMEDRHSLSTARQR